MHKKKLFIILILLICISACNNNNDMQPNPENNSENITNNQSNDPLFFESDEVINDFFTIYNSFAEIIIPAEEIEAGNIRTKALVYIDDLSLEIINANSYLSISMSSSVENENTKLFSVFRDTIKTLITDIDENDIQLVWNNIHESGYLVENYDFKNCSITYVPFKELSNGNSDLRIDIEFPLDPLD